VHEADEVFAITSNGTAIRTPVVDVRVTGRDTMGVKLVNVGARDAVVSVARNAERAAEEAVDLVADVADVAEPSPEGDVSLPVGEDEESPHDEE
jgi:DNA gyrase subunit A